MTTNQNLMKADLVIADLTSRGGLLSDEQAATFIRKLIKQPTLLAQARIVEMTANTRKINKIQFGKRILRAGVEATALDTAAIEGAFDANAEKTARAKPITEQITLTAKEVIAEVHITYDVMEDNIERASAANNETSNTGPGGLRDTIIDLIVERAALDLEELGLLGDTDTGSTDPFLDLTDGFIKRITDNGNTSDNLGATIDKSMFKAGLKAMPDQYLRTRSAMRHFVSVDNEVEYRDTLANRATGMGDALIQGVSPVFGFGVPVEAVQLMPETKGLFMNPLNMLYGIQRNVSLEFDKDITKRIYKIVLTARVDIQVEETDAAVIYLNIG